MSRRPPISTRTDTLFPYTTLFRSQVAVMRVQCVLNAAAQVCRLRFFAPCWKVRDLHRKTAPGAAQPRRVEKYRSEEHTSELQSLMRISYAVFCLKKQINRRESNTYIQYTKQHIAHTQRNKIN